MKNTAEDLQQVATQVTAALAAYIDQSQKGVGKVLQQLPASELAQRLQLEKWITDGGITADNVMDFLLPYLENTQHMNHPGFIGHQVATPHMASGIADYIHGVINNPMAIYEMGPAAAVIEKTIINWMLQKAGWWKGASITDFSYHEGNGSGILTHGGSQANMTAMLAARAAIAPEAWDHGVPDDLVVLGSEVAHYSMARAISMIGLGKKALVPVRTTEHEVLLPDDLYRQHQRVISEGKRVMAVVANACATSTGLYDPIDEMSAMCEEHGLWLHIDGAHGASALLSDYHRHHFKGIHRAKSMIWDAHKMLRTSALCAAVLFRDDADLANTFQQKGSYIFHEKEQPGFDLMPYAIECTKAGIGTKLFWVLAAEGEDALADYITGRYDVTRRFYDLIHAQDDFDCPYVPESNILCFRYTRHDADCDMQLQIRNRLVIDGDYYITSAEVSGRRYLRFSVMNELTMESHVIQLLDRVREIATTLY